MFLGHYVQLCLVIRHLSNRFSVRIKQRQNSFCVMSPLSCWIRISIRWFCNLTCIWISLLFVVFFYIPFAVHSSEDHLILYEGNYIIEMSGAAALAIVDYSYLIKWTYLRWVWRFGSPVARLHRRASRPGHSGFPCLFRHKNSKLIQIHSTWSHSLCPRKTW